MSNEECQPTPEGDSLETTPAVFKDISGVLDAFVQWDGSCNFNAPKGGDVNGGVNFWVKGPAAVAVLMRDMKRMQDTLDRIEEQIEASLGVEDLDPVLKSIQEEIQDLRPFDWDLDEEGEDT